MMGGCFSYTSLLQSTLECFYEQSCLDLLEVFVPGLAVISPISRTLSRFPSTTTVSDLLQQLFVESWNNQSNFTRYFQMCSPGSCSYSYDRRFNWLYVLVTLVGLFDSLKIITFSTAPIVVRIFRIVQKTMRNYFQPTINETTTTTRTVSDVKSKRSQFLTDLIFFNDFSSVFHSSKGDCRISFTYYLSSNSHIQSLSSIIRYQR